MNTVTMELSNKIQKKRVAHKFHLKDPGSAITHFIGMLMAIFAGFPLMGKAFNQPDPVHAFSLSIFIISMILLYMASTLYHTFNLSDKINRRLKKFDHMMISVMIAGSYTPICLIVLKDSVGIPLFFLIWSMALGGIILKAFWVYCPRWVSSALYIAMGWTCVLAFTPIMHNLSSTAFHWLLAGGIIYTIGGIIYALKLPILNHLWKNFGNHEIFHLFVMGGSVCHFVLVYGFVAVM